MRRPPPEAAARWRPVGCQHRVRYTLMCQYSHSCTYCGCTHCGCTVPGVVSQRPPASMLLSSGRMSSGRSANSSACRCSDECAIAGGGLWWVLDRDRGIPPARVPNLCQHDGKSSRGYKFGVESIAADASRIARPARLGCRRIRSRLFLSETLIHPVGNPASFRRVFVCARRGNLSSRPCGCRRRGSGSPT